MFPQKCTNIFIQKLKVDCIFDNPYLLSILFEYLKFEIVIKILLGNINIQKNMLTSVN